MDTDGEGYQRPATRTHGTLNLFLSVYVIERVAPARASAVSDRERPAVSELTPNSPACNGGRAPHQRAPHSMGPARSRGGSELTHPSISRPLHRRARRRSHSPPKPRSRCCRRPRPHSAVSFLLAPAPAPTKAYVRRGKRHPPNRKMSQADPPRPALSHTQAAAVSTPTRLG